NPNPDLRHTIQFSDRSIPITLSNPIILAAGSNKTGEFIPEVANLGFGGVTVGTATRHDRVGNTHRPRVNLIEGDRGMQNSMGLNNPGIDIIAKRVDDQLVKAHKNGLSVGLSVAETPGLEDEAQKLEDIVETFRTAYKVADYVEVNVSCPNTGEQRLDLDTSFMEQMFGQIMKVRKSIPVRKAVYAKLSPDLTEDELRSALDVSLDCDIAGWVLTNTTLSRERGMPFPNEGGVSGKPLTALSERMLEVAVAHLSPELREGRLLISCGGVMSPEDVFKRLEMGADLVQCYTALIYRGPFFFREVQDAASDRGWNRF
ncbi:MAG: hypothetical protein K2X47_13505, partial [Bdellovibrionales bacterium]|nr:hypothetical protein [Bdellovibrionales bacterium]